MKDLFAIIHDKENEVSVNDGIDEAYYEYIGPDKKEMPPPERYCALVDYIGSFSGEANTIEEVVEKTTKEFLVILDMFDQLKQEGETRQDPSTYPPPEPEFNIPDLEGKGTAFSLQYLRLQFSQHGKLVQVAQQIVKKEEGKGLDDDVRLTFYLLKPKKEAVTA